ncbi:phage tail protein [Tateyamaria omphalii]|uniref:Phage tail protein n=1 Tax=Tateyamaria omphalii TaxID=299262 RepID=A0A1P8MV58_9RHOB|nr:phage tail protein [Tateyamaria omphalii]APX11987.1 hypothetical protein BWR18_10085 [Tateyamaria omphalii]
MTTDKRIDPLRAFNFLVAVDSTPAAGFSEVSGLGVKREMVAYRNGNDVENHDRKLTGRDSYDNITLKRGYTTDDLMWRWFASLSAGNDDRRNVTITLLDEARSPVMSWLAEGAWILNLMGPSFNATGNDVAIESIELVIEKLTVEVEAAGA